MDYRPLDLTGHLNTPAARLPGAPPVGAVTLRGLPFQIGPVPATGEGPCVLVCAGGDEPVTLPIGACAHRVIVLHARLREDPPVDVPVGQEVARYHFHLAGGEVVTVPIRERFELSVPRPPWGQLPFLCHADQPDRQPPRERGPWADSGERLTEVVEGWPAHYYLYVWQPPDPLRGLKALVVEPLGPPLLLAGLTLGLVDEDPIPRDAAVPVVIELTDGVARPGNLELAVDRGTATWPFALPAAAETFGDDPLRGFGEPQNPDAAPAVAQVSATPSATLTVGHGGEPLGAVRWGEVTGAGEAADGPVRVRVVEDGRNWVHTRVVDADTGQPLPCRIHFRSPAGVPYQPHGHHAYAASNLGSWHYDVGGDLRLGQVTYAYIDGTCQGWLPRGEVWVDVARGFEYQPLRAQVTIERGQRELELRLQRVRDLNAEGYYSGDSHVHFLSTAGAHLEAAGEGLNVVNLLQSQWGHLFTNTEEFTGEASVRAGQRTIVYAAQENRQHLLGHLTLLNQKRPIMPWCTDGPSESFLGDNLEVTLARWADACHEQGGTVVLPHMPNPNGEPAVLVATGRVDAVEWASDHGDGRAEYYRWLNAGYRLPLVGGTDKMTQDVPVGLYRTYVYLPPDEEFTYDAWCRHLRGGNTFLSGGPLLSFRVEGQPPGATLRLPPGGGTVHVEAVATCVFPIRELQLVRQGRVVAEVREPAGAHRLELRTELALDGSTWLAARVGDGELERHRDGWSRAVQAHASPVYVATGETYDVGDAADLQYLLTLVDGSLSYVQQVARRYPHEAEVTHHHGLADHQGWLEEPFRQAQEALHRRLHALGVPH